MANDLSDPTWWWSQIVVPNYEEYKPDPTCVRRAFNAIIAMHHMWDRVYWWNVQAARMSLDGPEANDQRSKDRFRCFLDRHVASHRHPDGGGVRRKHV